MTAEEITDEMVDRAANALWRKASSYPYGKLMFPTRAELRDYARVAVTAALSDRDEEERKLGLLRKAIQTHLDTFGYDNHEGLADALVAIEGNCG